MAMNRLGETGMCPQRTERFFKKDSYWYYSTREGVDIGPFDSQRAAEAGVNDFINFIRDAEPDVRRSFETYVHAA